MITRTVNRFVRQKPIQNLAVYGIGQAFNLITPLLVIPYIISVCGLANYGKAAFAMALVFFLIVFIDYGSDIAGVKAVATDRDDNDALESIFTTTYAAKFVILTGVLLIMSLLFFAVPYLANEKALFFLGLPILVGQFLNPTWFLQGTENFTAITIVNVLSKCIYLTGIFCFVTGPSDYVLINLWWGIGMIVANGVCFIWLIKKHQFEFSRIRKNAIREHLKQGFPIFSSQIFVAIQLYSPLLLIGFFGTPTLAGIYRVVDQIVVIFKTYILLFFNFVFPRVCYLLTGNHASGIKFWYRYNGLNFIFIVVSMAFIAMFSEDIVGFFTDSNRDEMASLLEVAVWIPIMMALSVPLKQLVLGFSYNSFYVNVTIALSILNVIAIIVFLNVLGLFGVLYSLIATEALTVLLFYFKINKPVFLLQK